MARIDIIMPQLGESIAEGTVVKWLKKPGDKVGKDESILEITTDKVDSEIPSPSAGILVEIVAPEGTTVGIGLPLGILETDATAAAGATKSAPAPEAAKAEAPGTAPGVAVDSVIPKAPVETSAPPSEPAVVGAHDTGSTSVGGGNGGNGESTRFYSPLVKRIAREEGVALAELDHLTGSGQGGRVNKDDLLGYLEQRKAGGVAMPQAPGMPAGMPMMPAGMPQMPFMPQFAPMPQFNPMPGMGGPAAPPPVPAHYRLSRDSGATETRLPWDNVRKKIAAHMVMSKSTSPHVTSCAEIDVTTIVAFREAYKDIFQKTQGVKLTYTPFFLHAVVKAIQDFPGVNAIVDGETTVIKHHINLGMAVAMDDGGLIVPVLKHAEEKNFVGMARGADDLGRRAKSKKLVPDDVSGGTFTITNPGVFGGLWGTPIINQPQVAIFGMGTINKRVAVVNNMIAIRDMIYVTLSYDHRVVDGALSHLFLGRVKWYMENYSPVGQIPGII
ncbi:MAG: dihydrolipoamide acetyltransferase family protein [Candidatus Eisenbacteria bacterium]|nr:dihydrolipoamide acetyltransferase family protein [Candidatus Eisenbacteria bacterium]